jgi:Xaa-Pro aminopeptidase
MNLKNRVKKFSDEMKMKDIDISIIFGSANIRYFTNLRMNKNAESILVITSEGEISYLVPRLDLSRAKKYCWIEKIISFPEDNPNYLIPLKSILNGRKISRIGIEVDTVTLYKVNFLKEIFDAELIPVDELLIDIRAVKTSKEIELIRESARIADKAMQESLKLLHEGIKESDISSHAKYIIEKEGGEGCSFEIFVMSGENAWLPQRISTSKEIKSGELVLFDMGAVYEGYCSDMTRTFTVGGLNSEQKNIFNIAYMAQQEAIKAIKPGMKASEIDHVARSIIEESGYGNNFPHLTGHGIGISIHEKPILDRGVEYILKSNMVVTVEPGIYVDGIGSARIEDMVLITDSGCEILTSTDRLLI